MKNKFKKFVSASISMLAVVGLLLTNKVTIPVHAQDMGEILNGQTVTLKVGDTATLKCARPYGYDSLTAEWSTDKEGVIKITEENPGNGYSTITSASIEAESAGTVLVTMKAVSPWGEYFGCKTEKFTVIVEDNKEEPETKDDPETPENPETKDEPETPEDPETKEDPETPEMEVETNPASLNGKTLFVRLVGGFSHMMLGEEDVDAVSGATGVGYKPQEANAVKVQAVLVEDGTKREDIADDQWKSVEYFSFDPDTVRMNGDTAKTYVNVSPSCPGIDFFYDIWKGEITASGKATQAGQYNISLTFTDVDGRVATTNEVGFKVYDLNRTLVDSLTYENSTKTADGKYIYDQVPWYLPEMGGDTVVVPKDIKAWYGSHTAGTYAEVGKIISLTNGEQPTHTLVIPTGANLTLLNTRIHSDVKVVVEEGAKFSIRQSTIEGIIEVKNGGTFSVDYNDFGADKGFLSGSAINGQIVLEDGAVLENAHIVSHTNYSARDDINRKNNKPIVVVNGNATIKGEVIIEADEAADYGVGQTGMQVNGTLNIPEGSVLKVYGGGESQLSSKGGDAIVLNNGKITGDGELVAVGGFGMNMTADRSLVGGGAAVSGKGAVAVKSTTLTAGQSFDVADSPATVGEITIGAAQPQTTVIAEESAPLAAPAVVTEATNNTAKAAAASTKTVVNNVTALTELAVADNTDVDEADSDGVDTAEVDTAEVDAVDADDVDTAEVDADAAESDENKDEKETEKAPLKLEITDEATPLTAEKPSLASEIFAGIAIVIAATVAGLLLYRLKTKK